MENNLYIISSFGTAVYREGSLIMEDFTRKGIVPGEYKYFVQHTIGEALEAFGRVVTVRYMSGTDLQVNDNLDVYHKGKLLITRGGFVKEFTL